MPATRITDGSKLSVGLVPAEARDDRQAQNAATARINRTENGERSDAILVTANCSPAGTKPGETAGDSQMELNLLAERRKPSGE